VIYVCIIQIAILGEVYIEVEEATNIRRLIKEADSLNLWINRRPVVVV
jgi:hypothetical protein